MSTDVSELYQHVLKSGHTIEEKRALLNDIRKLRAPEDNRWNFWYVIFALAMLALSVPCYSLWQLAAGDKPDVPDALLSVAATSVGALAGFLMRQEHGTARNGVPVDPNEKVKA